MYGRDGLGFSEEESTPSLGCVDFESLTVIGAGALVSRERCFVSPETEESAEGRTSLISLE